MKVLQTFLALAVTLYLALLAFFFFSQRKLLYHPTNAGVPLAEAGVDRSFQEFSVKTGDGLNLTGWYAPATTKPCTIVFFHGNADSRYGGAEIARPYLGEGYGFLATEYRGYSGQAGTPSEAGLYKDARAYLKGLTGRGIQPRHILLFGHSLGTGVAVQMGEEFEVGGVMLLAPYLSIPKLAQVDFPLLPASLLALDRFDNESKMDRIRSPLLIANGDQDQVIPPSQGTGLYALAPTPKEFHSLPGRGHDDAFDDFSRVSLAWIDRSCSPP